MGILMRILGTLFIALLVAAPAFAADIKATVTEVNDQRSTGSFFNNLEIKLKLVGDDAPSVRGIKTTISKAVDDTGRNLLLDEDKDARFETVGESRGSQAEVKLKLKNPARRATVVKEIAGELQLFMPDQDPAATVLIKGFMKAAGKPISEPALAKAGVTVTVLTKKEYESLKKEEEQKAKDAAQKKGLSGAMMQAFEGLFSAFFQVGENDLIFKVGDPSGNLIDLDVVDAKGAKIKTYSSMRSTDVRVLNYQEPVPADAQLKISLKTQRSVVSLPLRLVDVALP